MKAIDIFEKHFIRGMKSKDFKAFKRTHTTLTNVVVDAINETLDIKQRKSKEYIYFVSFDYYNGKKIGSGNTFVNKKEKISIICLQEIQKDLEQKHKIGKVIIKNFIKL
jgi:hypothetical protein